MVDTNHVLFSGYARLPGGLSSSNIHATMALVILLDLKNAAIVKAECTLSTKTSENYISNLLEGKSLAGGVAEISQLIGKCYEGNSKKAILTALRSIYNNYRSYTASNPATADIERRSSSIRED